MSLPAQSELEQAAEYERSKGRLLEQIQQKQREFDELKGQRKQTERHLSLKDLPEKERLSQLATETIFPGTDLFPSMDLRLVYEPVRLTIIP